MYDLWSLQGITWWKQTFSNKDVLALQEKQQELNFVPGTKYLYSNTNYILLTAIVEKVAGKSFVSFTNSMFKKLKMPDTSFEDDYTNIRGPIAKAYFNFDTWKNYNWIWNVYGDGNIFSTLADQLRWEQIIQGKIQSQISKKLLVKSQKLTDETTIQNYGYGLEFGSYKQQPYTFHEGATGAWKATVIRFPKNKISIVTLTNTGKATTNSQTRQMADVLFNFNDKLNSLISKPERVGSFVSDEDMVGVYQTDNNFTFQFEKRDTVLFLIRSGRNDVKLEREADNILHQTFDAAFKQEFKKNEKGELTVTAYYTSHAPYTLTKLNPNWDGFKSELLNGKFLNTETNVTAEIKYIGNKNYDVSIGNKKYNKALLISPNKLLVDNYVFDFGVDFMKNQIFFINGERIENVKFVKVK